MAYNDIKLRFGYFNVNIAKQEKQKKAVKNSKTVIGLTIRIDGEDKVALKLSGDDLYPPYLVIPFEEESLNTVGQDKVYLTNEHNKVTVIYKPEYQVYPRPYKVYAHNHLVKGVIKTLTDKTRVFKFIEDLGLCKKEEDAPVNNLK